MLLYSGQRAAVAKNDLGRAASPSCAMETMHELAWTIVGAFFMMLLVERLVGT